MGARTGVALGSAAVAAALVVVAATGDSRSSRPAAANPAVDGTSLEVPAHRRMPGGCPVTRPGWTPRRGLRDGRIWVAFGPTGGIYRVPRENVGTGGALGIKIAWQRGPGLRGRITVVARRLDERASPVRRRIPATGYGLTGLQASGVDFPTQGCWRVTASAGGASVTFVLLVLEPGASRLPAPMTRPRGAIVDCARRSEAGFPGGFTAERNLVAGPLALVGAGERTSPSIVRDFGGNKFPLLVRAGHTVTVRLPPRVRSFAGLAYGGLGSRPLPQGEVRLRDTAHTMTFVACEPGPPSRGYRPDGPSASRADGEAVSFWSGFVVARRPGCVPLELYVDDEPSPRRAVIDMGGRSCAR